MALEIEIESRLARYGFRLATGGERGQFVIVELDGDLFRLWAIKI